MLARKNALHKIEMYRWDGMEGDVHVYTFPSKNIENDLKIFSI